MRMQIDDPEQSNLWRETSFAFHLLRQTINPTLSLKDSIDNWKRIAKGLAEGNRTRVRQLCEMYSYDQDLFTRSQLS
jgi:hypothetical protein